MDEFWSAVCSGDLESDEEYYQAGGKNNQRFGDSLIMGAVRNGQYEMVRLLRSHGKVIEEYEEDE